MSSAAGATYHVAQMNPEAADQGEGAAERPFKTISRAAERAEPGDLIRIHAGVYRERVLLKGGGTANAPIRVESEPGDHVVLTGADRITGWRRKSEAAAIYEADWPHRFITWNASMTHPAVAYHKVIGRCEQVVVNGYLLRQVLEEAQMAPGTFFTDVINRVLLAWDSASRDLNKAFAEASVRQEIMRVEGDYVEVRGLNFRYAANMAQHGAIVLAGKHALLEDCVIELMNSSGASFQGEDAVVRRCVFRDNGQLGFGAGRAHRLLFTDCLVENNNTKNFDRGWEAGGNKLALCRDAILEQSRFLRNHGNGIWFDIGNTNCTVRNCLIADNDDAGIFYEISFALHAHDNVITRNGFAQTAGAWGAQAGISLSSSPGCLIERNLLVANREGFNFREQQRTTPLIEDRKERAVWNHDQIIRKNLIALNGDAQVWGWFDVKDGRHWPDRGGNSQKTTAGKEDIAGPYAAKSDRGQPQGLTLHDLNLRFDSNVYFANPGQGWFNWGPTWARHQKFQSLPEFQTALGIDHDGMSAPLPFADLRQLDFRLPAAASPQVKNCYPRDTVPGALLGYR